MSIRVFFYIAITLITVLTAVLLTQSPIKPYLFVLVAALISFSHGILWIGWKKMLGFFLLVSVISWSYETSSILTGFPFGNYHYTDVLGANIWLVPVNIMPAYFAIGYFSFVLAHILLSHRRLSYQGGSWVSIALAASFIMVIWDLTMDPITSTIGGQWVWENGGLFFGVPLVNFAGWFLCVFTFYAIFTFFNRDASLDGAAKKAPADIRFWIVIPFAYLTLYVANIGDYMFSETRLVTDPAGKEWWTGDIYGSLALISSFTILPIGLLAIHRLVTDAKADA